MLLKRTNNFSSLIKISFKNIKNFTLNLHLKRLELLETLKKIRTQNNDNAGVPILVVTANAVEGAREFYLEQGFTDYISKPINSDYLNSCLFKYLSEDKVQVKTNEE